MGLICCAPARDDRFQTVTLFNLTQKNPSNILLLTITTKPEIIDELIPEQPKRMNIFRKGDQTFQSREFQVNAGEELLCSWRRA